MTIKISQLMTTRYIDDWTSKPDASIRHVVFFKNTTYAEESIVSRSS